MFKALLRTRIQYYWSTMFNRLNKKKAGKGKTVLYALLAVYVAACILFWVGSMFMTIAKPFIEAGFGWLVLALAALIYILVSFIGSIFMTQKQIFEAKDNDLLMSMPIPPSYILATRMFLILMSNAVLAALILAPAFVVYCIHIPQVTAPMIIIFIFGFLLAPFLSTALSCVCGWAVAAISSRMRHKDLISTVLSIGLLILYMYINFNLQRYAMKLVAAGSALAAAISRSIPPAYYFGTAIDQSSLTALLCFTLWCLVPFAAVYFVLSKSFIRIATSNRGNIRVKYREKELKTSSVRTALVKKELGRFFSLPMYILNCSFGAVMALVGAGALVLKGGSLFSMFEGAPRMEGDTIALMVCGVLCFMVSMNDITAPSLSLEGKALWILKSLPINTKDIFYAKVMASLIITIPPTIVSAAVAWAVLDLDFMLGLLVVLTPMVLQIFISFFGLWLNLKLPRFDWVSEIAVIKQSGSVMAAVFGGMAIVAVPVLVYAFLASSVPADVYLGLCTVLFALLSLIVVCLLKKSGERIFNEL